MVRWVCPDGDGRGPAAGRPTGATGDAAGPAPGSRGGWPVRRGRAAGRVDAKGAGRRDLWRAGDASIPGGGAEAEATTAPPGAADEAGETEGAGRPPQDPLVLARSRRPSQVESAPAPRRTVIVRRGVGV